MERSRTDLAWVAGLYEGEGSCGTHFSKNPKYGTPMGSCSLQIGMTDEDTVRRVPKIVGFGKVTARAPSRSGGHNRKMMYWYEVTRFELVQAAVAMMWPWLGSRRREQAVKCLRTAPGPRWRPGAKSTVSQRTRDRARELMEARWAAKRRANGARQ